MKKSFITSVFAAIIASILTVGCHTNEETVITDLSLNTDKINLCPGQTSQLICIITPEDAAVGVISWSSENSEIATVNDEGLVTAISTGNTTITAEIDNFSATCSVTVSPVDRIQLNTIELELEKGQSATLEATLSPEDADISYLEWDSSDDEIATVSEDGTVTAVSIGETDIHAKYGEVSATCHITVIPATVNSIELDVTSAEIKKGETLQLTATVDPADSGNEIKWGTSNYAIATVSDGIITALMPGEVTITAYCGDLSATCNITVLPIEAESITFDVSDIQLSQGEKLQINATVLPEDYDGKITWTSSNQNVAQVNASGEVTGTGAGSAVITAEINSLTATCNVTVKESSGLSIGDYYYSDGTWSSVLDNSKTPIGIVFWVGDPTANDPTLKKEHPECTNGLVMALNGQEEGMEWWNNDELVTMWIDETGGSNLPSWLAVNAPEYKQIDSDLQSAQGYNNTKALEAFNNNPDNTGWPVKIAQFAAEYRSQVQAPANTSDWYIPSAKEMSLACTGEFDGDLMGMDIMFKVDIRNLINNKIDNIDGAVRLQEGSATEPAGYWTSSYCSSGYTAYYINITYAWISVGYHADLYPARCILAF